MLQDEHVNCVSCVAGTSRPRVPVILHRPWQSDESLTRRPMAQRTPFVRFHIRAAQRSSKPQ